MSSAFIIMREGTEKEVKKEGDIEIKIRESFFANLKKVVESHLFNITSLNSRGEQKNLPCYFYGSFLGEPENVDERCLIYELSIRNEINPPVKCEEICIYGKNRDYCGYMKKLLFDKK